MARPRPRDVVSDPVITFCTELLSSRSRVRSNGVVGRLALAASGTPTGARKSIAPSAARSRRHVRRYGRRNAATRSRPSVEAVDRRGHVFRSLMNQSLCLLSTSRRTARTAYRRGPCLRLERLVHVAILFSMVLSSDITLACTSPRIHDFFSCRLQRSTRAPLRAFHH